jgi:hypothetical protein
VAKLVARGRFQHSTLRLGEMPIHHRFTLGSGEVGGTCAKTSSGLIFCRHQLVHHASPNLGKTGQSLIAVLSALNDLLGNEQLLRDRLGASRVFIFDHNVRNAGLSGLATPSRQLHNDHTVNSAPRRVRDHLGAEADQLLKRRLASSMCGGRSVVPCSIRRWHCVTRGLSRMTT